MIDRRRPGRLSNVVLRWSAIALAGLVLVLVLAGLVLPESSAVEDEAAVPAYSEAS